MNMLRSILTIVAIWLFIWTSGVSGEAVYGSYKISGPYTYENLDIFFFHSGDKVKSLKMLTLAEALEQEKIVVHETGNVGELAIENSSDVLIFIHGGDIVKGGKQDRMIAFDVIIYPGSGRLPLKSFCVEQGRWSERGNESVRAFESSKNMVASKSLKIASKVEQSQGDVWSEVDYAQVNLADAAEVEVRGGRSPSSLQLTLENDAVKARTSQYIAYMTSQFERFSDLVGFAFTINGELNSADIYHNNNLFTELWPKLSEACAIEAFSQVTKKESSLKLTPEDIAQWLEQAETGKSNDKTINDYTRLKTIESETDLVFETYGTEDQVLIHKNVIKR